MAIQALLCEQCPKPSKYKCPKCETRSCSLTCVNQHKEEAGCDGLRNKTKYKALDNFTDLDMVNDFRLLEEISRNVDSCRRDKLKRSTRQGTEMMRAPKLPRQLSNLQNQANLRGTRLRYLPPHFTRRISNTTAYQHKTRTISWMMQLVFPHARKKVTLDKISERTKLWKIISDYVEFKDKDDLKDPFQFYRSVSYGGLCLYLKSEGMALPGEQPRRFRLLNMKRSLKTNLKGKVLVEYPIIHVVFKSDEAYKDDFDDTSDDEGNPTQTSNEASKIVTNEEELNEISNERHSWSDQHGAKEAFNKDNIGLQDTSVDIVLSQEEAQMVDPQAYKDYFDFYLKYYTQKMARQPGAANLPLSNRDPLRPSFVGASLLPSVNSIQSASLVPNICQPPPCGPQIPQTHQHLPQFTVPPPTSPYSNVFPPTHLNMSCHQSPQYRPYTGFESAGFPNPTTTHGEYHNKTNLHGSCPNQTSNKGGYPNRSQAPPKKSIDDMQTNLSNLNSARKIKEELREKPVGLTSLMCYGSGSSDSE